MPKDFWDSHDLGKRLLIIAITISFLLIVGASIAGVILSDNIVLLVGVITFTAFISLALGGDGTKKLLTDIIKAFKRK